MDGSSAFLFRDTVVGGPMRPAICLLFLSYEQDQVECGEKKLTSLVLRVQSLSIDAAMRLTP